MKSSESNLPTNDKVCGCRCLECDDFCESWCDCVCCVVDKEDNQK